MESSFGLDRCYRGYLDRSMEVMFGKEEFGKQLFRSFSNLSAFIPIERIVPGLKKSDGTYHLGANDGEGQLTFQLGK